MTIEKLDDFAENGDKNLTGIDVQQGFVQSEKPARQWFNWLFNSITKKVNEVVTSINELIIDTDRISDGAVTSSKIADESITNIKLSTDFEITGDKIAKDAELNTPKLSNTYALTTLDAPNINLAEDGTLKRSNDPLNASTRKVGTAAGNLVERGADGYPTNNNSLGVGQTWQDLKASRLTGVTYTNSTGRPIFISIVTYADSNYGSILYVDDKQVSNVRLLRSDTKAGASHSCVVPNGSTYRITGSNSTDWSELR